MNESTSNNGKEIKKIIKRTRKSKRVRKTKEETKDDTNVEKPQKVISKTRKVDTEPKKTVKEFDPKLLKPLFREDYDKRMICLKQRIYFEKNENKKNSFRNAVKKLELRPIIC